jgi:hypothetical protein
VNVGKYIHGGFYKPGDVIPQPVSFLMGSNLRQNEPTQPDGRPEAAPATPDPANESLADLLREVLSAEAAKQGKPPPSAEACDAFGRLLGGLPSGPERRKGKGKRKGGR